MKNVYIIRHDSGAVIMVVGSMNEAIKQLRLNQDDMVTDEYATQMKDAIKNYNSARIGEYTVVKTKMGDWNQ